ncbi:MAG TPA: DUF47 family protein [Amycolatopsis sp.]|nr:DUF47 family protein [Amycolatopsis sp.]
MRLTPRGSHFFNLLTDAAGNLVSATALLRLLLATEPRQRPQVAAKLRDVEHDGDRLVHEIMVQLNKSFITPFDREDIQALASRIDDVLDALYTAGDLVVLYRVDELPPEVSALIDVLCRAAELTASAMPGLAKVSELEPFWIEINDLENEADRRYRRLLGQLFEPGADPLTVMKIKEVLDQLEFAADAFEHVADVVQTIAVKES